MFFFLSSVVFDDIKALVVCQPNNRFFPSDKIKVLPAALRSDENGKTYINKAAAKTMKTITECNPSIEIGQIDHISMEMKCISIQHIYANTSVMYVFPTKEIAADCAPDETPLNYTPNNWLDIKLN